MTGPLAGIRVIEFAGLGPTPFAAMMLADFGAQVLRIEKLGAPPVSPGDRKFDFLNRGRPSIALDLKSPDGIALARALLASADVLLEGYRPGVMERLGLGPDPLMTEHPRLVYARMTGWGQEGPLALKAGHDINYIAMTGGLYMIGEADRPPPPPVNLFGDFGGGSMFVITGILTALIERAMSGRGQIVDAAMTDGAAMLLTQIFAWQAMGFWTPGRATNLLDGAAYFYRCYETLDGGYVAVGALEPQFHDEMIRGLGLDPADFPDQLDRSLWPARAQIVAALFLTRTRDAWVEAFAPYDACVTPVLTMDEAIVHPANACRQAHVTRASGTQPSPAPRLSRTPAVIGAEPGMPAEGGADALHMWGIESDIVTRLTGAGILQAL
jgi:alpha-methylacyl-CoA racemase